jgi:PEP-CTERM motif
MNLHPLVATSFLLAIFASARAADVEGNTGGTWVNPLPEDAVTTGIGTSSFTWGTGVDSAPSSLSFLGTSFSESFEARFKVGSIRYFNGAIFDAASSIELALSLAFTTPALSPIVSNYNFELVNTDNTGDPIASADFVNLPSAFSNTSFFIGPTEYRVKIVGFDNIVGDGFLLSNPLQFHVREQGTASADLFAIVTTQAVPEPSTYALMLLGLLGVAAVRRSQVRAPHP